MGRKPGDKILDNSFNTGNIEFEFFNKFPIEEIHKNDDNDYDKYREEKLFDILNNIIINTKWEKYKKRENKIPKRDLSEYFLFIRSNFKENTYSEIEIFIKAAEIVNVDYKIFYDMIPNAYKIILLKELDKNFNLKDKLKKIKLF